MSKTEYKLIKSKQKNELQQYITTYGIEIVSANPGNNPNMVITDISCDEHIVKNLIQRLNNEEIEYQQLMYIIEDFII